MNKQKWRVAILLSLMLCLLIGGNALASGFAVVCRTNSLNLRARGSSSSEWLGSYNRGTWVELTGYQENNFYQVRTPDGRIGYMSANYLDVCGDESDYVWTALVSNQNGGAFLNLREQPSYNARVLRILYNGVPLHVLNVSGGWYCVELNGQVGYVRGEFITDYGRTRAGSGTVATIKTPNNGAMNLRSGPGMGYAVIHQVAGDRYVSVLNQSGNWWCVSIDGYIGFMSSDFLTEGLCAARDLAPESAVGPSGGSGYGAYAVVNNPKSTQALNLRRFASTGSEVLSKLYNGTRLWVDQQGREWCAVTDQSTGLSGYVMTQYIKLYNLPQTPTRRVYHPSGTYVNLRSNPDMTQNNVRIRISSGQTVTVLVPGVEWCKVQYNGYTGYMLTYFLQ